MVSRVPWRTRLDARGEPSVHGPALAASAGRLEDLLMADDQFNEAHDRLFRSHFERVNQLADRGYADVQPAYRLGYAAALDAKNRARRFEEVETDLENGWLNVRVGGGEWASVRELARVAFDSARQGRVSNMTPAMADSGHDRVSYNDPLAGAMDPTDPASPEEQIGG